MNWLKFIFENSLSARLDRAQEKEDRRKAEAEALEYIQTQRRRRKEIEILEEQKESLEKLKGQPEADPAVLKNIESELVLKERLLSSDVLTIERNEYNSALLDAYKMECEELRRIDQLKSEVQNLEGSGQSEIVDNLKAEIQEKEKWMKKDVLGKLWPTEEE